MKELILDGQTYNAAELADKAGISAQTLLYRLRKGYTVEEAVREPLIANSIMDFVTSDDPEQWDGLTNTELYELYEYFCEKTECKLLSQKEFMRQIKLLVPIRIVPTRTQYYQTHYTRQVVRVTYKTDFF